MGLWLARLVESHKLNEAIFISSLKSRRQYFQMRQSS